MKIVNYRTESVGVASREREGGHADMAKRGVSLVGGKGELRVLLFPAD